MMISDGLTDAFSNIHMGVTAENVAKEKSYTQADQDSFAFDSQLKCKAAQEAGHFDQEIVSVSIPGNKPKSTAVWVLVWVSGLRFATGKNAKCRPHT